MPTPESPVAALQLQERLNDIKPPIWHEVLQIMMGW